MIHVPDQNKIGDNYNEESNANLLLQSQIDYETIGAHMSVIRHDLAYTQAQLAEILGLKPNYYGQFETGTRHINLTRLIQFICKTQCSADFLLRGCHRDYPSSASAQQEYSETRKELNSILDKCDDNLLKDLIVVVELWRKWT